MLPALNGTLAGGLLLSYTTQFMLLPLLLLRPSSTRGAGPADAQKQCGHACPVGSILPLCSNVPRLPFPVHLLTQERCISRPCLLLNPSARPAAGQSLAGSAVASIVIWLIIWDGGRPDGHNTDDISSVQEPDERILYDGRRRRRGKKRKKKRLQLLLAANAAGGTR